MPLNKLDPSTEVMPHVVAPVYKTATSYNEPGLPPSPAGYGKVIGFTDSVDADDEGPESKDQY